MLQAHMTVFLRTFFFFSAFGPALIVWGVKQAYGRGWSNEYVAIVFAGCIACVLPFLIIVEVGKRCELIRFSAKKVDNQDWMLIVLVVSYFSPLVINLEDYYALVALLVGAAILLGAIDALPCHPLLHLFSYRFYKVEGVNGMVYTMISRGKILSAADVKSVRQISSSLLYRS